MISMAISGHMSWTGGSFTFANIAIIQKGAQIAADSCHSHTIRVRLQITAVQAPTDEDPNSPEMCK